MLQIFVPKLSQHFEDYVPWVKISGKSSSWHAEMLGNFHIMHEISNLPLGKAKFLHKLAPSHWQRWVGSGKKQTQAYFYLCEEILNPINFNTFCLLLWSPGICLIASFLNKVQSCYFILSVYDMCEWTCIQVYSWQPHQNVSQTGSLQTLGISPIFYSLWSTEIHCLQILR